MIKNACCLLGSTYTLEMIHKSSASLDHAILRAGYTWQPYVPTHFIYAFFAYNSLYNVDWDRSLKRGKPYTHNRKVREYEKRDAYLDFCCQDGEFLRIYKDFFIEYVTARHGAKRILEEIEKIRLDAKYSNGNIRNEDDIISFQKACQTCLVDDVFDHSVIKEIEQFVYKIRCNLFHGAKTIDELNNPYQQIRLDIYSTFVVAINQMIFSYLEYLCGEDIKRGFDCVLNDLKWINQ